MPVILPSSLLSLDVRVGDCRELMREMPDESVQCCVTSPPYWGLRDYGHPGQIGQEETPEAFVQAMVEVFREVRRVLKPDGTLWMNLGDSYYGAGQRGDQFNTKAPQPKWAGKANAERGHRRGTASPVHGLKFKDMTGMPWRVAIAMQQPDCECEACSTFSHSSLWLPVPPSMCDFEDGVKVCPTCSHWGKPKSQSNGWYLRSDIIWHKPNPMPESVTDRPTKSHEYIFLLTKSESYFYDHEAIKESSTYADCGRPSKVKGDFNAKGEPLPGQLPFRAITETRNKRSVWTVPTAPYKEAHFATYPPDLIKPCIMAGTKPGDVVLDPFGGSGTTGQVALELGRRAILCELNPDYAEIIHQRTNVTMGLAL